MMLFKACIRCGGDMHKIDDLYGSYNECIQCGHTVDLPAKPLFSYGQPAPRKAKVKVKAASRKAA